MSNFIESYNYAKEKALEAIQTGKNIVLYGKACAGKTHLMRELCGELNSHGYCMRPDFWPHIGKYRGVIILLKTQKWLMTTRCSEFKKFADLHGLLNTVIVDMPIRVPATYPNLDTYPNRSFPRIPNNTKFFGDILQRIDKFKKKQVDYACVLLMCCERMHQRENKTSQTFDFGKELSILFNCSNIKAMIVKFAMARIPLLV